METERVSVLVEAFVFGIVHGGVAFEDRDHPGVIVVSQSHGEFPRFVEAEWTVGVREVEGTPSIVVAFLGAVADGHSPANSDGGLLGLPVGPKDAGAIHYVVGLDTLEPLF